MKILFLAKHKPFARDAAELLSKSASDVEVFWGDRGDAFPQEAQGKRYDYVISYLSPWIVPSNVLESAERAALNFHPGPPEYPGIGCTNFAIYNGERSFGITVHHMLEKVDRGEIVLVKRFPVFEKDSVYTLTQRCYAYIFTAFIELLPYILTGKSFPKESVFWTRVPYTRRELQELCCLREGMSDQEIGKRIKATEYPGMPGAYWVR